MTDNAIDVVRRSMTKAIDDSRVPGIAVAWSHGRQPAELLIVGTDATGRPLEHDSIFPVASLTKLAVALAVLRLADLGALLIDDPVMHHLPDAAIARSGATLRNLMTHTAGLPQSYPEEPEIYRIDLTWPRIAQACLQTSPEYAPDVRVQYSGVGYSLLAVIVERLTGQSFGAALQNLVLDPLKIEAYFGMDPPRPPANIEVGNSLFAGTELEFYNSAFFRRLGEPPSGLLTTADGALRLVRAFQDFPAGFLRSETYAAATSDQAGGLGGGVEGWFDLPHCRWGLGPGLHGTFPSLVPAEASSHSFGHQGASGCLAWCDPSADIAWAILGTETADSGWCDMCFPTIGAALLASTSARG